MDLILFFSLVCVCTAAGSDTLRSSRPLVLSDGLCQMRDSQGRCRPVCVSGCKHGECVGPDQCDCHPGFTGKTCNRDVNECALRPCKHRCMNTLGSFKCYCLDGFMAAADGSCRNARTCAMANCQYGCAVMKGEVTCQCPSPGLRLAPDGRTCVDVDECVTGQAKCARFRKCVNTFGSFVCRCHEGFELKHIDGKYRCTDKKISSVCYDKPGHRKCKCTPGVSGKGYDCKSVVKVTIEPARPVKVTASPTTVDTTTTPMTTTKEKTTTTTTIAIPTTAVTTETSFPTGNAVTKVTPTTVAMTTTESTSTTAPTTALTTTESTSTTAPTTTESTTTTALTTTESTTTTALTTTESTTTTALTTTESTTTTALTTTESTTTTALTTTESTTTTALTTTESTTTTAPATTTTSPMVTTTALTTTESTSTTAPTTTESTTTTALTTTESTTTTAPATTESTTTTAPATTTTSPMVTTTASAPVSNTTLETSSTTTLDNHVHRESTAKPRGDVHIPRHENNLFDWDFDVELGNTAEYVRDDPAAGVVSCSFDEGLCLWMKDSEGDLTWEIKDDPAGGRYLSVPEATNRRSVKGARLTVPLATPTKAWQGGDLCLAFRHRLHGNHIGSLQVFVRKGRSHSPSVWTTTGGHGWRHTHITLGGRGLVDIVLKAERRRGKHGEISVDDFSLRRGACSDRDNRTDQ